MKRKITLITILCSLFIISSLIGILFIKDVKGNSQDIEYQFTSDDLTITNKRTFNIKDQSNYTGHYNATYSFENEIGKKGLEIDFVDGLEGGSEPEIILSLNNHNSILMCNDTSITDYISPKNNFPTKAFGTIELWIRTTDKTKQLQINLRQTDKILVQFVLGYSYLLYYDLSGTPHNLVSAINNQWYHIRIDFECSDGNYEGLAPYKFHCYINGIKYSDLEFRNLGNYVNSLIIGSAFAHKDYIGYFDAIGYSWDDNYTIGQNLIPYLEINPDIQEVDKCEFAYNENTGVINAEGSSNTNGWTDIDDGNNEIQILHQAEDWSDCYVHYDIWYNNYYGITKDFSQIDGIFDITMEIDVLNFFYYLGSGLYDWNIYSYDDTLIVNIRILPMTDIDYKIYYYNGSDYIFLYQIADENFQDLRFNLHISSFCLLTIQDYDINNTYIFGKINTTTKGLNKIEFKGKNGGHSYTECYVDNIGVYVNGSSYLPNDLSVIKYDVVETWKSVRHNIIDINGNGIFNLIIFDGALDYLIFSFTEFTGVKQRFLYYDDNFDGDDIFMVFIIKNIPIDISEISIKAVCLKESTNKYYLSFFHNGINHNISYFYVDNNRLYFNHIADDDNVSEYIQAKFNVDNFYAINRSVNFNTYFHGISKSYFKVNYVSNINSTFFLRLGHETFNTILPQQQIINDFTILITDENNNDYYGSSTGYISSIRLIYYPNIKLTILTLSLIEIMIPLIVLLIPTIAISSVYGKKAIIPMLILMTIICLISNLIDVEIFFVMMLCLGSALFLQYKKEKEKIQ